jgi:hypothetical protein
MDIDSFSDEDLRDVLLSLDALKTKQKEDHKVTNDDELHAWIKSNLGINIPRKAVCDGHCAPFDPIADLFFERADSAIVVANRGGGKTQGASLWQFLNMWFVPQVECATVGAQDIQSKRAYLHFKNYQRKAASGKVVDSKITETLWDEEQKYEILTGSIGSVNGPHPQRVHRDEVELMDKRVYQESLQMEASKRRPDGTLIKPQTMITSTRKASDGLMQELLDSCKEAEQLGMTPPFKIYIYCVKETVEKQDGCRIAYPDLPEEEKCTCHKFQKGEFDEDQPRTLDVVCNGDFSISEGFQPLEDIQQKFLKSSKAMWEAQQECKRPYTEDISLEAFSRERHGIRGFVLDPENGPIFQSVDVGGTSPWAVEWGQLLFYEIEVLSHSGQPKRIPQGSLVLFDEIYITEVGNNGMAELIVETERQYKMETPKFRVRGRFIDPQAKTTKIDFRKNNPPLRGSWPAVTRDREEHFKKLRTRVVENKFYVCLDNCPMFVEEVESWNINIKNSITR